MEWGIFSEDGLLEGDFYSREDDEVAALQYDKDDNVTVAEVCPYHRNNERHSCEFLKVMLL